MGMAVELERAQLGVKLEGCWGHGETIPFTIEIRTHICSCHNFSLLSSVQILLIPACCLLCVL